jgi:hypothetical protein
VGRYDRRIVVTIEQVIAAIALAACVLLLARMLLGQRRRRRIDAGLLRAIARLQRGVLRLRSRARAAWRWRAARREAARMTADAIRRARETSSLDADDGEEDDDGDNGRTRGGNVYRPKSFRRPRKPH